MSIAAQPQGSTRKTVRLTAGIASVLSAVVVLAGVPALLWRYVGWPFPSTVPTMAEVRLAIELRDFSDRLLTGTLAVIVWICWALTLTSIVAHIVSRIGRSAVRRPSLVPAVLHQAVGKWVGSAALLVTLFSRPAGATTAALPTTTLSAPTVPPTSATRLPTAQPETPPKRTSIPAPPGRTYVVGPRESLWSVAEATLGDGSRWKELLDANRSIINDPDMLVDGITLTIPDATIGVHTVEVELGDNLWSISRAALKAAGDDRVTNAEVAPYWVKVVDINEDTITSRDPDLIYPGEEITLPNLPGITQEPEPTTAPVVDATPTTVEAPIDDATTPTSTPVENQSAQEAPPITDQAEEHGLSPWIIGLAISGVGAAAILATMARNRRRIMRTHTNGSPTPRITPAARTLISQLSGLGEPERITAIDKTLRYLFIKTAGVQKLPQISIVRAGEHNVELLARDAEALCPEGFALLDNATLVVDPAVDVVQLNDELRDTLPLCPALVSIGADATGDILIDLERVGALTVEADTRERAFSVLAAIALEQAGLPWATENGVYGIGLPPWIQEHCNVLEVTDAEAFARRYGPDDEELGMTHDARLEGLELLPPTIVLIGPDHPKEAQTLAELAILPGSGLAVVTAAPQSATNWRLVITKSQGELEPVGLNLTTIPIHAIELDETLAEQIDEVLNPPLDDEQWSAEYDEPLDDLQDESYSDRPDSPEVSDEGIGESDQASELEADESSETLGKPELRPVDEVIAEIMQPSGVELYLLGPAPRLEGIERNGKPAARADEIIAFVALHGATCPRELGEALWPGKRNTAQQVSQATSRARAILGATDDGRQRLTEARRNAPYQLQDVGCDWHRFRLLVAESKHRPSAEAATLLKAALTLVTGSPFSQRRERSFEWAADCGYQMEIALAVADAAERLGELALIGEDPDTTLWAASQGMLAIPDHEALLRLRIRAHTAKGDIAAARLEYRTACERLEEDEGLLSGFDPATLAIFESALRDVPSTL